MAEVVSSALHSIEVALVMPLKPVCWLVGSVMVGSQAGHQVVGMCCLGAPCVGLPALILGLQLMATCLNQWNQTSASNHHSARSIYDYD